MNSYCGLQVKNLQIKKFNYYSYVLFSSSIEVAIF
jgi:hypothetical protein